MSTIPEINAQQLSEKLKSEDNIKVIDVREEEEVAEGMIPGAVHVRLGELPERYEELNREDPHVLVCRSGGRSMKASQFLKDKGFTDVTNLDGGMLDWSGDLSYK